MFQSHSKQMICCFDFDDCIYFWRVSTNDTVLDCKLIPQKPVKMYVRYMGLMHMNVKIYGKGDYDGGEEAKIAFKPSVKLRFGLREL